MEGAEPIKIKICLVGESAVGKTSLIKRYVLNKFADKYITTIGTIVTKKEIKIKHPEKDKLLDVRLLIWDIMGQLGFRQMLQQAYFFGAQGIVGVCDITREDTLSDLEKWMDSVLSVIEEVPIAFLGNKCDLEDEQEVGLSEIKDFASAYKQTLPYLSSAKTGFNVELAFKSLSELIVEDLF